VLGKLGLSQTDAEVYIYLATNGPKKAKAMVNYLDINREQVYRSLKRLQNRGITISNDEHPIKFSAVPFEEVLDMLLKLKKEEAKVLQESKEELISDFKTEKKKSTVSN